MPALGKGTIHWMGKTQRGGTEICTKGENPEGGRESENGGEDPQRKGGNRNYLGTMRERTKSLERGGDLTKKGYLGKKTNVWGVWERFFQHMGEKER